MTGESITDESMTEDLPPVAGELPDAPKQHQAMDTSYLDDEAVIFDDRTAMVHRLNPSATIVWTMCDGETTVAEMLTELADAFGMPPDVFQHDVDAALRNFWEAGMLEGSPPVIDDETAADVAEPRSLPSGLFVLADAGEP